MASFSSLLEALWEEGWGFLKGGTTSTQPVIQGLPRVFPAPSHANGGNLHRFGLATEHLSVHPQVFGGFDRREQLQYSPCYQVGFCRIIYPSI